MTRPSKVILLCAALLSAAGCDQRAGSTAAPVANEITNGSAATAEAEPAPPLPPRIDTEPDAAPSAGPGLADPVLEKVDISVNGQEACALKVQYASGLGQPVTWNGEPCGNLTRRLSSVEDLRRLEQKRRTKFNLTDEMIEDIRRLPGGRALYIEGHHASAVYPQNAMGQIYGIELGD